VLEPCEGKLSRTVLRGERGGNAPDLPGACETMDPITELLTELEVIGVEHEELYDTDVREQMAMAVVEIYLRGNVQYELPGSYCMFSDAGDRKVHEALKRFAEDVTATALDTESKLNSLAPKGATSPSGQTSEYFFGALAEFVDRSGSPPRFLWWDTPVAYFGCMVVAGALIFLLISVFVPLRQVHPLWLVVVLIVCGGVGLAGGDTLWQFIADRTLRAQNGIGKG